MCDNPSGADDDKSHSTSSWRGRKKVSRAKPVSQEAELCKERSETEKQTVISVADMEVDGTKKDQSDSTSGQLSGGASQSELNKRGCGKASTPQSK